MMDSESEGIIVISCNETSPENVILQILQKNHLPDAINQSNLKGYPWTFETKYYSAKVYLFAINKKVALEAGFCNAIKAVIFYFDDEKSTNFGDVLDWMPYLKNIDAEVQLLICNNANQNTDEEQKKTILSWCVKNHFELVELNSLPDSDNEDDQNIKDVTGFDRVIQSLQSHPWANLVMKGEIGNVSSKQECALGAEASPKNEISENSDKNDSKKITVENEELELEDQWLSNVLKGEDPGGESFEALFAKFASMKDRASGLSGEERKKYAEKVAVAFWRAMGGDEDEIEGLDEDD